MRSRLVRVVGLVAVVCVVVTATAAAQSDYAITSEDSSPIPERSFSFQGQTHTVDAHVNLAPGEELVVDVSAPDEVYRVYVYNGDEQIVDRQRGEGDGTFAFDLTGYDPGSYAVTAYSRDDGEYEAFLPVLVRGYDVETSAPSSVNADETFEVSIAVTEAAASGEPATVSAVLASDAVTHTVEASGGDGSYTATVDADEVGEGEYTVYGVVQGTDEAFGRDEVLGLAAGGSVSVTAGEESGNGANGGGGDGDAAVTATPTPTNETATPGAETAEPTATETPGDVASTPTQTATSEASDDAASTPAGGDASTSTNGGSAITPVRGTTESTTEATGPGFPATVVAVAVVVGIGLALWRWRSVG